MRDPTHGSSTSHSPVRGDLDCPLLAPFLTHLDNVEYSFQIRGKGSPKNGMPGAQRRVIVDRQLIALKWRFKKELSYWQGGEEIHYPTFHLFRGGVHRSTPSAATAKISLAKRVFDCIHKQRPIWTKLVDVLTDLYRDGILVTNFQCPRQAAYYLLETRGTLTIESAIDIRDLRTEKCLSDHTGKFYQRKNFSRLETRIKGKPRDLKEILLCPTPHTTHKDLFIEGHVRNILAKLNPETHRLKGIRLGRDKHHNRVKLRKWVSDLIDKYDFEHLDKETMSYYTGEEWRGKV